MVSFQRVGHTWAASGRALSLSAQITSSPTPNRTGKRSIAPAEPSAQTGAAALQQRQARLEPLADMEARAETTIVPERPMTVSFIAAPPPGRASSRRPWCASGVRNMRWIATGLFGSMSRITAISAGWRPLPRGHRGWKRSARAVGGSVSSRPKIDLGERAARVDRLLPDRQRELGDCALPRHRPWYAVAAPAAHCYPPQSPWHASAAMTSLGCAACEAAHLHLLAPVEDDQRRVAVRMRRAARRPLPTSPLPPSARATSSAFKPKLTMATSSSRSRIAEERWRLPRGAEEFNLQSVRPSSLLRPALIFGSRASH